MTSREWERAKERHRLSREADLELWMTAQASFLTSQQKKDSTIDQSESEKESPILWHPTLEEHFRILRRWLKRQETLLNVAPKLQSGGSDNLQQAMVIFSYWQTAGYLPSGVRKEKVLKYLKEECDVDEVIREP